ncbi:hypothetical protein KP509_01G035200 [Ceratopteris richardii]|uniref:Secreted protein n=1 Tax=Ceratopteris richardii TaxID=49495 RepID=A0A8T2VJT5_CERRI|nr:hypothetical protein KP509_01G035200 [Ceratopteris richardii]
MVPRKHRTRISGAITLLAVWLLFFCGNEAVGGRIDNIPTSDMAYTSVKYKKVGTSRGCTSLAGVNVVENRHPSTQTITEH